MGWIIVCLLPILFLWWEYLVERRIEQPQINSTIIVTICIFVVSILLDKLTKYPGQRALVVILPLLFVVSFLTSAILIIFRISYSVYQLSSSFFIGAIFFLVFQLYLTQKQKFTIAYLPFGRCKEFNQLNQANLYNLYALTSFTLDKNPEAIVADLSSPEIEGNWQRFLAQQTIKGMPVYNYLQIYESLTGRSPIQYLYENDLGSLQPSQGYLWLKRWLDIGLVLLSLPIVLPIMLLTALLIKLGSEGKIIFVQERIGQAGKPFKMYKFRSMKVDTLNQKQPLTQLNDIRVTNFGRVIRKLRIDELPQFYNVLKGDMSLIGPRPELPSEVARLEQEIPFYIYRQIVKPGISGWAQVMQGEGHVENIQTKLEYDFYYIKNFSITLDFLIVIKTIQTMLTGFGAR